MTATTRSPRSRPSQTARSAGTLVGPVIAVQPWPPLLVQASWWADPATRHDPLAIVADDGALLAVSIEALAHGVMVGQTLPQACLICPALVVVPPERAAAAELWHHTLTALLTLSPVVEAGAPDRSDEATAYIDGRGLDRLWGDTRAVARKAVHMLAAEGLVARAGAGPSRAVASALARRMDASGPRVLFGQESRAFVAALPLADPLFALDAPVLDDLRSLGLRTAGRLATLSRDDVVTRFGPAVSAAWAIACGAAEPPLRAWTPPERIAVRRAFDGAVDDRTIVEAALIPLCRELDAHVQAAGRATEVLSLQLTCEDAPPVLRCLHPTAPLQGADALILAARSLWQQMQPPAPIVALTLTAARLCPAAAHQETLFGVGDDGATKSGTMKRAARLAQVLQAHRAQFGPGRVRRPRQDPLDPQGWTWSEHEP